MTDDTRDPPRKRPTPTIDLTATEIPTAPPSGGKAEGAEQKPHVAASQQTADQKKATTNPSMSAPTSNQYSLAGGDCRRRRSNRHFPVSDWAAGLMSARARKCRRERSSGCLKRRPMRRSLPGSRRWRLR